MKNAYQTTGEFLEEGNKKSLFDSLYLNSHMEGGRNEIIVEFLKDISKTFVSDVAEKYLKWGNPSEKQVWCMVFESLKIKDQYNAWADSQMELV